MVQNNKGFIRKVQNFEKLYNIDIIKSLLYSKGYISKNNKDVLFEVFNLCEEYPNDIYFNYVQMDTDGLIIYKDNLILIQKDFIKLPNALRHFKEIKGDFQILECKKLKDLTGLENIKSIKGNFKIKECKKLKNLKGLENLKLIGCKFDCSYTDINFFEGLENLEIDINNFYPSEKREEFLHFQKDLNLSKTIEQALKYE